MANAPRKHYQPGFGPKARSTRAEKHRRMVDKERWQHPARKFYRGPEWRRFRANILKNNPFCVVCGGKGQHVDHIIPVRIDWERRLDPTNMQVLCHPCHSRKTGYETHLYDE